MTMQATILCTHDDDDVTRTQDGGLHTSGRFHAFAKGHPPVQNQPEDEYIQATVTKICSFIP